RKKKALEEAALAEAEEMERQRLMQEALGGEGGEGPLEPETLPPIQRIEDEVIAEIREFTMANPEVAAQMVKTWLRSEDEF
ncbi:MAG: hypothetical protein IK059_01560, partial [Firmicutes bacterium]|nr:hypothetical protein [Bacillota bacterium]